MRCIILIIVSSYVIMTIIFKFRERVFFIDKNYNFHFISNIKLNSKKDFLTHIIDVNIVIVQIKNIINQFCVLSRNVKIKKFRDYEK